MFGKNEAGLWVKELKISLVDLTLLTRAVDRDKGFVAVEKAFHAAMDDSLTSGFQISEQHALARPPGPPEESMLSLLYGL
jgi:hypothetical protein